MSPFFIKTFKRQNKCPHCSRDKASGYSLCPAHLEVARQRWRSWSAERRAQERCVSCDRRSRLATRGVGAGERREIRCKIHARINTLKCRAWAAANPGYHARSYKLVQKRIEACRGASHKPIRGRRLCGGCITFRHHQPVTASAA